MVLTEETEVLWAEPVEWNVFSSKFHQDCPRIKPRP